MAKSIRVIRKPADGAAEFVDIDHTLLSMQEEVDGYIKAVPLFEGIVLICNEDGKVMGKPNNFPLPWGDTVVGNALFVRDDGSSEFTSVVDEDMDRICKVLGLMEMGFPV